MKSVLALLLIPAMLSCAAPAFASSDALLDLLVKKKLITQQEADEVWMELQKEETPAVGNDDKTKVSGWIDELKWSGDLRLRYEFIDNADQVSKIDRSRFRLRLRLGLETKFQDWARLGVRVATGGDDPVATNQSFTDTFSRKPIDLDLAYVTLTPPGRDFVSVSGGKIVNPIWQPSFNSPMQYDYDVTPEGAGEQAQWKFGDKKQHRLFANLGQFALDEVGTDANDPYLLEFQGGAEAKFDRVRINVAGGWSQTHNLRTMGVSSGSQPAGSGSPASQSSSGNRGNATRQPGGAGTTLFYLDDFEVAYGGGEIAWKAAGNPFLGTPVLLTFSGEYIHNFAEAYDNLRGSAITKSPGQVDGWTAQAAFGELKKRGHWQLVYQYKHIEADAAWDAISDSDWGTGGTDREGHSFRAAYNLREWWQLSFGGTLTQKISSRPNTGQDTRGKAGSALLRVQADTLFKF